MITTITFIIITFAFICVCLNLEYFSWFGLTSSLCAILCAQCIICSLAVHPAMIFVIMIKCVASVATLAEFKKIK